jgi:hypothetical protein
MESRAGYQVLVGGMLPCSEFRSARGFPRSEDFFQRLHPDDQPSFRELIQTAIREKAEFEADYRIVHPDGPVRDIHVVGHPVLSTSGDLVDRRHRA